MTAPLSLADIEELRVDAPYLDQPQLVRAVAGLIATLDALRQAHMDAASEMLTSVRYGSMSQASMDAVMAALSRAIPK